MSKGQIKEAFPEYEKPTLSVDIVILSTEDDKESSDPRYTPKKLLKVLLIKSKNSNEKWRLPGSFMHLTERPIDTINRILETKIGVSTKTTDIYTEQLYTEADRMDRDPRGRVVSLVYIGIVKESSDLVKMLNLSPTEYDISWQYINSFNTKKEFNIHSKDSKIIETEFDHSDIIYDSIVRLRNKLEYTDIIFKFLENKFTFREFEETFAVILNKRIAALRRNTKEWLIETEEIIKKGHYRPARLFVQNKEYFNSTKG